MEPAQDDDVEAAAVAVEETELVPVLAARPTAVAEKDDLGFNSDISMRTYIMDTLRGRPFASTDRRRNPRERLVESAKADAASSPNRRQRLTRAARRRYHTANTLATFTAVGMYLASARPRGILAADGARCRS